MKVHKRVSIDKEILRALSKRTPLPWVRDGFLDWAAIAASIYMVYMLPNPLTFILALLIIGNRQHALVILGHDGTHFTLSTKKVFNDFLTNFLCFWPVGMTVDGYRSLHYKHHKHTGEENDPEVQHKKSRSPQWDLPTRLSTILKYALMDIFGCSIPDYYIIVTYSKPARRTAYIPLFIWHISFISTLLILGLWLAAILWYASLLSTFMMFFRLRLWLEHQGTSETHRLHLNFWQAPLLAPHYSWLHWEHHNWPSIPYHRLVEVRKHFPDPTIISLKQLLEGFKNAPRLSSGEVLVLSS